MYTPEFIKNSYNLLYELIVNSGRAKGKYIKTLEDLKNYALKYIEQKNKKNGGINYEKIFNNNCFTNWLFYFLCVKK